MNTMTEKLAQYDWAELAQNLDTHGYAVLPQLLSAAQCQDLIDNYTDKTGFRKTVPMRRYRFGEGEYKYWDYPLPCLVQQLREEIYPYLVPVANRWMTQLNIDTVYPAPLGALTERCRRAGQHKPTPLILRYEAGGYNTLHQDLYGEVYFPLQALCVLNQVGEDYSGGEFVLTEQVPRAQSIPRVLMPNRGDLVIFSTHFRPQRSVRGYHRVTMRHGVSRVHSGERFACGIIFHDAVS